MSGRLSDSRAVRLSELGPRAWYADHLGRSTGCTCTTTKPDRGCDLGEALFRLAISAREGEKPRQRA